MARRLAILVAAAVLAPLARARLSPQWQVVSDARGVTTRARVDAVTSLCAVHGEAVVDLSVGALMSIFGNLSSYDEWDETISAAREWTRGGETYQYQRFAQPWPVADRELVVRRRRYDDADRSKVAFRYDSVDDETAGAAPPAKGTTRTLMNGVWWNFTSVSETTTLVSHYSCVDPGGAIPGWARDAIVQRWCQSQIVALVETAMRLQRPPVEEFAGWGHPTALGLLHLQSGDAGAAASRAAAATPAPRPPGAPFEFEVY